MVSIRLGAWCLGARFMGGIGIGVLGYGAVGIIMPTRIHWLPSNDRIK